MKIYNFETPDELRQLLKDVKSRINGPFAPKWTPSEKRALQAERDNLKTVLARKTGRSF